MRLDQYLSGKEEIKSRVIAKKMIEGGLVMVNGKLVRKPSLDVSPSDTVEWKVPPSADIPLFSGDATVFPVLFEDAHCLVIDKPAGIAVHPGTGMTEEDETILSAVQSLFAERGLPFSASEVLAHRLDKDTTGCLLLAKTPAAHMNLQAQFAARTVRKTYLALVAGTPSPASAMIDAPIGRHATVRTKMSVYQATASREATTSFKTIGASEGVALLACDLHTGRTHQIRVHLSSIGHPVLGDPVYGSGASESVTERLSIDFLCLHAWKLSFLSPSGKTVSVVCPLPKRFEALLKRVGIREYGNTGIQGHP